MKHAVTVISVKCWIAEDDNTATWLKYEKLNCGKSPNCESAFDSRHGNELRECFIFLTYGQGESCL